MNDLISRQAAIEAVHSYFKDKLDGWPTEEIEEGYEVYCDMDKIDAFLSDNKYLTKRIEAIPSADRPKWIPCSERLPKIGEHHISEPCLVYCKGGVYSFAELEENIFGQVGWNCERDDDYHEPIGEVVAWMPLPEAYREDGEEE